MELKAAVLEALRARVAEDLAAASATQREAVAGATHEESRAENDKDTRGLEASYLARGLAARVAELEEAARRLAALELRPFGEDDPVALGALVTVEEDEDEEPEQRYFMAPAGGGIKLAIAGTQVQVVTPSSPLGRTLLGKRGGDEVELRTPRGSRTLRLARIC